MYYILMSRFSTNNTTGPQPRRRGAFGRNAGRLYAAGLLMLAGMLAVTVRLFMLQVQGHGQYIEQARRQYESKVTLQSERGVVYDRNGNLLVSNATSTSFAVDPRNLQNRARVADLFRRTLGGTAAEYTRKVNDTSTSFAWLRRKVYGPAAQTLSELKDEGLIALKEPMRHAEYGSIGAQVLGCTDVDNNGIGGVELFYDSLLKGTDGYIVMQRDARGRRRPDLDLPQSRPQNGNSLVLTLDATTQQIVEDELRKGVQEFGAASGTAVAINPRTGEILALAAYPGYDPNDMRRADQAGMRVRAITDVYEPGSTMKVITAAATLQEGTARPTDMINCQGGSYSLGAYVIRDDHPAGVITISQAFAHSSNIAFAKLAQRLPRATFCKYVRDFGFGMGTGIDLPGEVRGDVKKPALFSPETQSFMAFGYQLAVTPLQLVCAYAAIANDGVLMKPHLLKRRMDRDGNVLEDVQPVQIRRVVSPETAGMVRDMMVQVVENGTGREARLPGLPIAGKTGTTQQLTNGTYSQNKHIASFVGFFPADKPSVALLVLLDAPTNGYYGGQVAAPVFRRIAKRLTDVGPGVNAPAQMQAVADAQPDNATNTPGRLLLAPDLRGVSVGSARDIAARYGFTVASVSKEGIVLAQQPPAGSALGRGRIINLNVVCGTTTASATHSMPDVRGLPLRRALNLLNAFGLAPRVNGAGVVCWQNPLPGTPLRSGTAVGVGCAPANPQPAAQTPPVRQAAARLPAPSALPGRRP